MTNLTADVADVHLQPVRHTPQWTRTGVSNGHQFIYASHLLCWCGLTKLDMSCPSCNGTGQGQDMPCPVCQGTRMRETL